MVPCKFYGIAAAGRPTLYIGDTEGEIPQVLREADCGTAIQIGDSEGLAACIGHLMQSPEQINRWSRNARGVLQRSFDREHAIRRWCEVLERASLRPFLPQPQAFKN